MEEIKTPAPVWTAETQGLNRNNIVSLSQVRARKKTKFLAVRQPAVQEMLCVGCEKPFPLKQSERRDGLCPPCYSYYQAYAHNNAALQLLQEGYACPPWLPRIRVQNNQGI